VAGCLDHLSNDASCPGVAALDRGGGQEYLAHQRAPCRQVPERRRVQVLQRGVVIAGGERGLSDFRCEGFSGFLLCPF
jgi:hypothetical protein